MSTAAQVAANRENATKSTGPKTPEGLKASSQNNLRHGFCGAFQILAYENPDDYDTLLAGLRDDHKPSTMTEEILIERMAQHLWLVTRAQILMDQNLDAPAQISLWLRYQSSNQRGFHKCLNDLLKLRAEKRKWEIGFERQKQAEAAEARKQELNQARVRVANANTAAKELDTEIKSMIQAQLPGHATFNFDDLKGVISAALRTVAAS